MAGMSDEGHANSAYICMLYMIYVLNWYLHYTRLHDLFLQTN